MDPGEESQLFKVGGPFSTCDQKIKVAHALGLIGSQTKADLERINEIRNIFAHDMNLVSFNRDEILSQCEAIHRTTSSENTDQNLSARDVFVLSVQWIVDGLISDANERGPEDRLEPVGRRLSA